MEGMTFEGVVCKGVETRAGRQRWVVFKVKKESWIARLRDLCQGDEARFQQLL